MLLNELKNMKIRLLIVAAITCCHSLAIAQLEEVEIQVSPANISILEANPFFSDDVYGKFVGADVVLQDSVDINYRGAYQLKVHMVWDPVPQRNWKVKLSKDARYRDRREWNYNYENHPRHELAYYIFREAGQPVASCRHVALSLNGNSQGLYVEYEDIDNKRWLTDNFGDNDGDLFKAAYDIPDEPRYFAGLNDLGDTNEDYFWHYRKKTNHKGTGAEDYSSIIDFVNIINDTPDDDFVEVLKANFETATFIKYLVVANFISNWDSYPVRPKNYWLYQNPATNKWTFIPWDLDATFQRSTTNLNKMGTDASIFYQFDKYESYDLQPQEGSERPLVRRMMGFSEFRDAYIREYKRALKSYLDQNHLYTVLDSMQAVVQNSSISGYSSYKSATSDVKSFIVEKTQSVGNELIAFSDLITDIPSWGQEESNYDLTTNPNPSIDYIFVEFALIHVEDIQIDLFDLNGQRMLIIEQKNLSPGRHQIRLKTHQLSRGSYILKLQGKSGVQINRILVGK